MKFVVTYVFVLVLFLSFSFANANGQLSDEEKVEKYIEYSFRMGMEYCQDKNYPLTIEYLKKIPNTYEHYSEAQECLKKAWSAQSGVINNAIGNSTKKTDIFKSSNMEVTANIVNVRDKPSLEGSVIAKIKKGQENIKLIGRSGDWWNIAIFPSDIEVTKENFESAVKIKGYAKEPYITVKKSK